MQMMPRNTRQAITKEFFERYIYYYNVYISEIMFVEVNRTQDESRKELLLTEIAKRQLEVYDIINDEFDILLSWNFRHLDNIKKQMAINAINESDGYSKKLSLLNPMEVIYEK